VLAKTMRERRLAPLIGAVRIRLAFTGRTVVD
jgi:hypothetical protein